MLLIQSLRVSKIGARFQCPEQQRLDSGSSEDCCTFPLAGPVIDPGSSYVLLNTCTSGGVRYQGKLRVGWRVLVGANGKYPPNSLNWISATDVACRWPLALDIPSAESRHESGPALQILGVVGERHNNQVIGYLVKQR